MTYLVTGCAGFIGSKVTEQLLHAGHEVVGLDGFQGPYPQALYGWRLGRLTGRTGFRFVQGDVRDADAMADLIGTVRPEGVLHLAARPGVRMSLEDPWVYLRTNAEGTLNVLEACRKNDVPRMVLASTSSVYGAGATVPFTEGMPTDRPLSPYAASKKAAEAYACTYHHLYGIHTPRLRYFTVYGPAGRPDMAVLKFIDAIAHGKPITVYGDGSQRRDFTFVEDIARGTIASLNVDGDAAINLGSDRPQSVNALIACIEAELGAKAIVNQQAANSADMPETWANIGAAADLLDWAPVTRLAEGVRATVAWYEQSGLAVSSPGSTQDVEKRASVGSRAL